MKKIGLIALLLSSFIGLGVRVYSQGTAKTVSLDIKGMTCASCAAKIESSLKKLDGVEKVSIDSKTGKGSVEYTEGKVTSEQILDNCNKTGFKCSL